MELQNQQKIINIVQTLLQKANIIADVSVSPHPSHGEAFFVVDIHSLEQRNLLIGKNGQNLNALEYMARLVFMRQHPTLECNFIIDVDDYRKSKASYIITVARQTAQRVLHTKRAEALNPMSSYERRLVHMELAAQTHVQTESIGQEPYRRVVIKPDIL